MPPLPEASGCPLPSLVTKMTRLMMGGTGVAAVSSRMTPDECSPLQMAGPTKRVRRREGRRWW